MMWENDIKGVHPLVIAFAVWMAILIFVLVVLYL